MHFDKPDPWAANPRRALDEAADRMRAARQRQRQRIAKRAEAAAPLPPKQARFTPCTECLSDGGRVRPQHAKRLCMMHYSRAWRAERRAAAEPTAPPPASGVAPARQDGPGDAPGHGLTPAEAREEATDFADYLDWQAEQDAAADGHAAAPADGHADAPGD